MRFLKFPYGFYSLGKGILLVAVLFSVVNSYLPAKPTVDDNIIWMDPSEQSAESESDMEEESAFSDEVILSSFSALNITDFPASRSFAEFNPAIPMGKGCVTGPPPEI